MRKRRIEISSGFVLLAAVLFYLDEGIGLLFPGLLACAFHELGHILAIRMLGGRTEQLKLTAAGAELILDGRYPLSYVREMAAAFAGPAASLLCAWGATRAKCYLAAGLNLTAGIFNLLPMYPLDGGRIFGALLSMQLGVERTEKAMVLITSVFVGVLLGSGFILWELWGNPTLAVTSAFLLVGTWKRPVFCEKNKKILANRDFL